jgi:hypothetical protein
MKKTARKNRPTLLYVVTDEGKTVEGFASRFEATLLKWGLKPLIDFLERMMTEFWPQFVALFKDSALIVMAEAYWKQWISWLEELQVLGESLAKKWIRA